MNKHAPWQHLLHTSWPKLHLPHCLDSLIVKLFGDPIFCECVPKVSLNSIYLNPWFFASLLSMLPVLLEDTFPVACPAQQEVSVFTLLPCSSCFVCINNVAK